MNTRILPFLFILLFAGAQARSADPVAIATSVTGKATFTSGGETKELAIGQSLSAGDAVAVASGTVSIVFNSGDLIALEKGETLTLGAEAASSAILSGGARRGVVRDELTATGSSGIAMGDAADRMAQLAHISAVRGIAKVIPVSPRLAVGAPALTFVWFDGDSAAAGKKKKYTLLIRDEAGRELYRYPLTGRAYELNSFTLVKTARILSPAPGRRYNWGVFESGKMPKRIPPLDAQFLYTDSVGMREAGARVAALDQMLAAKKIDRASRDMLLASWCSDERRRLFADAVPCYLELARMHPSQRYPLEQLALLLGKFGNEVSVAGNYCVFRAQSIAPR